MGTAVTMVTQYDIEVHFIISFAFAISIMMFIVIVSSFNFY
mgnify:FL=1